MINIAVIEDDKGLNSGIALALKNEKYVFHQYFSLNDARKNMQLDNMDLIVLDVNFPDGSGFDMLKEIREKSNVPVIILTANDLEIDEVKGISMGADDYITKPFSLMVLRARIENALKHAGKDNKSLYECGKFSFDFTNMIFMKDGKKLDFSKTEQKLLKILIENRGHQVARNTLVDYVWTDGAEYVDENALSVTIKRLRDKLEDEPGKPEYIQTVYGIGYIWRMNRNVY